MVDRIGVPLELEGFVVTDTEIVNEHLEVGVRSTIRPACHHCGSVDVGGHAHSERRIRDRSCGRPTVLRWQQRRFRCRDCRRTFRERHPCVAGRKAITNRFRRQLFERSETRSFVDVAAAEEVSTYRVVDSFEHHAVAELLGPATAPLTTLGIDESSFRRGRRYHTAFCDIDRRALIDFRPGRTQGTVLSAVIALPDEVRWNIRTVVMDMHEPFRKAARAALPDARIVVDKFHVIRAVTKIADRIRIRNARRGSIVGRRGGSVRTLRFDRRVVAARWVLCKRAHALTEAERTWLESIFESHPEIAVAWLMKEALATVYDAPDRAEAERRLDTWVFNLDAAGIEDFKRSWNRKLALWRDEILAYFDAPVTNAFTEGITNKIKVIKRSAYGYRNPERYRLKVLVACGYQRGFGRPDHRNSR
jgi:transposase